MNSPLKNPQQRQSKLYNIENIKDFQERVVGDIFKYKNRVVIKVVFRSVLSNVQFTKHGLYALKAKEKKGLMNIQKLLDKESASQGGSNESNKSDEEDEESDDEEEEDEQEDDLDIYHKKKLNLSTNSLKQLGGGAQGVGRNSFADYLAHRKGGHHHHGIGNRLSLQNLSDGDDFGSLALVPGNNKSENDVESARHIQDNEKRVLMNVTFGLTLLNANPQNKKQLLDMLNELYKKHLEHLAFLEKKRREQEEKRLKELEEQQRKKKFTLSKKAGFKHDTKTVVKPDKKNKNKDKKVEPVAID